LNRIKTADSNRISKLGVPSYYSNETEQLLTTGRPQFGHEIALFRNVSEKVIYIINRFRKTVELYVSTEHTNHRRDENTDKLMV